MIILILENLGAYLQKFKYTMKNYIKYMQPGNSTVRSLVEQLQDYTVHFHLSACYGSIARLIHLVKYLPLVVRLWDGVELRVRLGSSN